MVGSAPTTPRKPGKAQRKSLTSVTDPLRVRGIVPHAEVSLFIAGRDGQPHEKVGTATLFGTVEGDLAYMNHGADVRACQSPEHSVVLVWKVNLEPGKGNIPYPYKMPFNEEQPAPERLSDMSTGFRYAWDVRMMEAVGAARPSAVRTPPSSPAVRARTRAAAPVEDDPELAQITPASPKNLRSQQKSKTPSQIKRTLSASTSVGRSVRRRILPLEPDPTEVATPTPVSRTAPTPGLVTVIEADDDEDDRAVASNIVVPQIKLDRYTKRSVWVNVDKISFMEHTVRETEEGHVLALEKAIRDQGSLASAGSITVTVQDEALLSSVHDHIDEDNKLQVDCIGVDGRHRTVAYQRLQKEATSDTKKEEFTWIRAQLYTRPDGKPMSGLEIIAVGANLNEVSSTVRKSTFADNVHSAMSCVSLVQKELGTPLEKIRPTEVGKIMTDLRSIPGIAKGQYTRYARIALAFRRNHIPSRELKRFDNLGVVHLSNDQYLKLDRPGMLLGLESVSAYLKAPAPRGMPKGPFEDAQDGFYDSLRELYAQARASATDHNVQIPALLDTSVPVTRSDSLTVRDVIRNQMANYSQRGAEKMQKAQSSRLARLRKCINDHYAAISKGAPEDESRAAPASTTSARPVRTTAGKPPERTKVVLPASRSSRTSKSSKTRAKTAEVREPSPPPPSPSKPPTPVAAERRVGGPKVASLAGKKPRMLKRGARREEAVSGFDDDIPALNPVGYNDPPVWDGDKRPLWVNFASVVPSQWPKTTPIEHPSPWLHALFIPPQHRAHVVCNVDDLLAIHRAVFYHAAKQRHRELRSTLQPVLGVKLLPLVPKSPNSAIKYSEEEALWAAAVERDELALEYFGQKRGVLDSLGYCILEGFCSDKGIPDRLQVPFCDPDGDVIAELADYFVGKFPGEEALRSERNRTLWSPIVNTRDTDEADRSRGKGRFITTMEGICAHLEQEPDLSWVVEKRAMLDARLGQILAAMRLGGEDMALPAVDTLKTPRSGGRFLLTGEGCPRQALHTDFQVEEGSRLSELPGYFLICTTGEATPLWVVDHSHFFLRRPPQALHVLSRGVVARKVIIPPYSVLIGRGDLQHAGAGHEDNPNPSVRGSIRYHIYFVPHTQKLMDGVHYPTDLNPDFEEDESEESEGAGGDDGDKSGSTVESEEEDRAESGDEEESDEEESTPEGGKRVAERSQN